MCTVPHSVCEEVTDADVQEERPADVPVSEVLLLTGVKPCTHEP